MEEDRGLNPIPGIEEFIKSVKKMERERRNDGGNYGQYRKYSKDFIEKYRWPNAPNGRRNSFRLKRTRKEWMFDIEKTDWRLEKRKRKLAKQTKQANKKEEKTQSKK